MEKILVAMSGGVDSSLTAALLKEQGYHLIGVTMDVWKALDPEEEARQGGCCTLGAVEDARQTAFDLGMPYYVMNLRDTFQETVIRYFIDEYTQGRTPNPCIMCNKVVKFDILVEKAKQLGCSHVATGHYARIEYENGRYVLKKARDTHKDQTYVLYGLTQDQLAHVLFPLGGYLKEEVRKMSFERGLISADRPDSQEICFVTDNDYKGFLKREVPDELKLGPIYDMQGNRLGTHEGIALYTIGQRKGLGITSDTPLYVAELRSADNAVIVGKKEEIFAKGLIAEKVNWIAIEDLTKPTEVTVKVRYKSLEVLAMIEPHAEGVLVTFKEEQRAVTPGQAVVFYDGDSVVGGGTITKAVK